METSRYINITSIDGIRNALKADILRELHALSKDELGEYICQCFHTSDIIKWLGGTESYVHDENGPMLRFFQTNWVSMNLLHQPVLCSALRKRENEHADTRIKNILFQACEKAVEARRQKRSIVEDLNIDTICRILVSTFKFDTKNLKDKLDFEECCVIFATSDTRSVLAANAHTLVSIAFISSTIWQAWRHCQGNAAAAAYMHQMAGGIQCIRVLLAMWCKFIPNETLTMCILGTFQIMSDIGAWTTPTDIHALHSRRLQHFTNQLAENNLISRDTWNVVNGVEGNISNSEYYDLWGHYIIFTAIFALGRRSRVTIYSLIWLIVGTMVAAAGSLFQYHKDAALLPPNFLDARFHAAQNTSLWIANAASGSSADAVVLQQSGSYMLVLAAACANPAFYNPYYDMLSRERFPLKIRSNPTEMRNMHQRALQEWRAAGGGGPVLRQTEMWLALRPQITNQVLYWMKYHLDPNSLVFATLFSKLQAKVVKGAIHRGVLHMLFDAFQFSVMAFVHYAHIQPFRGSDEAVHANVFFNPRLADITEIQFLALLKKLDRKLTEMLVAHWNKGSNATTTPVYAQEHLIEFQIVYDKTNVGFWTDTPGITVATFMQADIQRQQATTPNPLLSEQAPQSPPDIRNISRPSASAPIVNQSATNGSSTNASVPNAHRDEPDVSGGEESADDDAKIIGEQPKQTQSIDDQQAEIIREWRCRAWKQKDAITDHNIRIKSAVGAISVLGLSTIYSPIVGIPLAVTGMAAAVGDEILNIKTPVPRECMDNPTSDALSEELSEQQMQARNQYQRKLWDGALSSAGKLFS